MKAYQLIAEKRLEELDTQARLYRHLRSGAQLLTMKNKDDNKVFSIAFRTPPSDSTGVPHIMEHSVLCGSEKFPLKDPFVELAKGSLNTFLNAMTYPDKTVYPIASQNEQDFKNLMDVYMDAVLHPNIAKDDKIFRQEGWHYELESVDGELSYNGVVYNEMKGAFSNPESVLERAVMHALFPDTAYGNESGGDPECIPRLSYEAFKAFHERYYHPSNAYIYLYGDVDMEERMAWLDEHYLSAYEQIQPESELAAQAPFAALRKETVPYSIGAHEAESGKTYLSLSYVLRSPLDVKLGLAMDVLEYALLNAPGAPLKQALLDAGIGEDIMGGYQDGILQPYFSVIAKNTEAAREADFVAAVEDCLRRLTEAGLDRKALLAGINSAEFQFKEADYGRTPKGLIYGLMALDSWLYDGEPWLFLQAEPVYAQLRAEVESGYFEELIRTQLLHNSFAALVSVVPRPGLTEAREAALASELANLKAGLSQAQLETLVRETEALRVFQDTPSTEEELRMLPLLNREDIRKEARALNYQPLEHEGVRLLYVPIERHGISYLNFHFDTEGLSRKELACAALLQQILGMVDTEAHTYQDLNSEILLHSGGISMDLSAFVRLEHYGSIRGLFTVNTKLLQHELDFGFELVRELVRTSRLEDRKRLTEILNEQRSRLQMKLDRASHVAAVNRASAYFSENAAFAELVGGVSAYRFVSEQCEAVKSVEGFEALRERLYAVIDKLFVPERLLLSLAGDAASLEAVRKHMGSFVCELGKAGCGRKAEHEKKTETAQKADSSAGTETENAAGAAAEKAANTVTAQGYQLAFGRLLNEGFKTASQVNYVARVGHFDTDRLPYTGALRVLKQLLNYEYLWLNLRVKGGAYGCMSGFTRSGEGYLVSYRDPKLAETLAVYEALPAYLEQFDCSERDMTKYVIGAVAELDMPQTDSAKLSYQLSAYLSGVSQEDLQRERDELLGANVASIRALAAYVRAVLESGAACTIGSASQLEKDAGHFGEIKNLYE